MSVKATCQAWYQRHKIALRVIGSALILDALCGWWFAAAQHIPVWHGLYCALADAVTFGGDVQPSTPQGYMACTVICITVIPLFGAAISLFTSRITTQVVKQHVDASEENIKSHVEEQLAAHTEAMKEHIATLK